MKTITVNGTKYECDEYKIGVGKKGTRLDCHRVSGLSGDNFGFPWAVAIPAIAGAIGAIGGGIFQWQSSQEQRQAAESQIPIAQMQFQTAQLQAQTQMQLAKQKRKQILIYGAIGIGAILLLKD